MLNETLQGNETGMALYLPDIEKRIRAGRTGTIKPEQTMEFSSKFSLLQAAVADRVGPDCLLVALVVRCYDCLAWNTLLFIIHDTLFKVSNAEGT